MNNTLLRALVIDALIVVILFPYSSTYSPGTNILRGPLWQLRAYSVPDIVIGLILISICFFLLDLFIMQPSWKRSGLLIASVVIWIGFGFLASYITAL